jgi:hypothetical protein
MLIFMPVSMSTSSFSGLNGPYLADLTGYNGLLAGYPA